MAGLWRFSTNVAPGGAGGWTIRRFAPQWDKKHNAKA
jgi:hypothetical protein